MPVRPLLAFAFPALLAACVPPGPEPMPPEPAPTDACGASAMQDLVGQPESVLMAMTFANPTRFIKPGMAVTLDFVAERLNISIGKDGRIDRVDCG